MRIFRTKKRFSVLDLILWSVVGGIAALWLVGVALELPNRFRLNHTDLIIGIVLTSLTCLGVFLRWGPVIPCMFLGMGIFSLLTSPISSSHEEVVFKDLGVPLMGAIFGAIFGYVVESQRPCPKQPDVNGEPDGD